MEPRLTSRIFVFRFDRFVVDVHVLTAKAHRLLHEPVLGIGHQLAKP